MTLPALIADARHTVDSPLPRDWDAVRFARFVVAVADLLEDEDALGQATRFEVTAEIERRMAESERAEAARAETEEGR